MLITTQQYVAHLLFIVVLIWVFERKKKSSQRLHLFDKKYSKNSKFIKYYHNDYIL